MRRRSRIENRIRKRIKLLQLLYRSSASVKIPFACMELLSLRDARPLPPVQYLFAHIPSRDHRLLVNNLRADRASNLHRAIHVAPTLLMRHGVYSGVPNGYGTHTLNAWSFNDVNNQHPSPYGG